ncbi:dihydrofolate reductase family protein [Cytophagales bacterium LB-30]|uniref:Dihydrofolate reductase family protein n=1 Tax=Shiella aurantiaca TaxID=3058365 RepID=A0ABT8F5T2_9BACT|nr:dihydrofolate reductase family protein [Shiella aurantiaca]MDN4165629.1 dihydrofolate reductase family protein [Shiella aurantiaca]
MRQIIYYVASSLDGYIAGPNEDVSGYVGSGSGVDKYFEDLQHFDTVIMGKNTYEFGYKFGLKPGQKAYPHMKHFIFSNHLVLEKADPDVQVKKMDIREVENLRQKDGTDIYLCGGGQFATWLLKNQQIDQVKIKLNPLILGGGIKLFEGLEETYTLELLGSEVYEKGLQIMSYRVIYK